MREFSSAWTHWNEANTRPRAKPTFDFPSSDSGKLFGTPNVLPCDLNIDLNTMPTFDSSSDSNFDTDTNFYMHHCQLDCNMKSTKQDTEFHSTKISFHEDWKT